MEKDSHSVKYPEPLIIDEDLFRFTYMFYPKTNLVSENRDSESCAEDPKNSKEYLNGYEWDYLIKQDMYGDYCLYTGYLDIDGISVNCTQEQILEMLGIYYEDK